jgi:hypothetical protein
LCIAGERQRLSSPLVCQDAGLRKAIYAFANFGKDMLVVDKGVEVLLVCDFLWFMGVPR